MYELTSCGISRQMSHTHTTCLNGLGTEASTYTPRVNRLGTVHYKCEWKGDWVSLPGAAASSNALTFASSHT